VFTQSGAFDGAYNGSPQHSITYKVILTVSEPNKADKEVLESETSSPAAKAVALAAMRFSEAECDSSFDVLLSYVWSIISDARNHKLQQTDNDLQPANLKIKSWQKDEPTRLGNLTTLTGNLEITCSLQEDIDGQIPQWPATLDKFFDDTTISFYDTTGTTPDSTSVQIEVTHDSEEPV
jgi:hypothetical protein